ncbi:hypothetical protein [Rhodopseudomonas palustris]|uniref:Uncharacterized protein n=1 Tax=Rhodopseudomonas palustris (strain ATCC BAA-98 / CGA009) TaxID=258594 RepID=Q6N9M4_RHOPA|nr:hypothetical protein [Rhodopseudomonas palustris]ACF00231.1 conserved hypothetical protein [Rhodopseudomonas palustris TIE-1]QQM03016.1 hypothetical protein I8G32_01553 [Rhodopseudomonas palustris]WAB79187.1 hypothetical protein OR798_07795 [Rhodopseudomonas palustris]WCL91655.1 hypothetical protein TX73_007790 [Rhodopseudomonas palustris CGA009]CAE26958.1 hypothetical protein RPA1516 [Rhodopseudomonas palustris CGA009]
MEEYYGLIELILVVLCVAVGWLVLERQGKRLDRARAERDKDPAQ